VLEWSIWGEYLVKICSFNENMGKGKNVFFYGFLLLKKEKRAFMLHLRTIFKKKLLDKNLSVGKYD